MNTKDEAIGGVLIFLFGAVTTFFSLKMPIGSFRSAGPGLFPLCLGILLMAMAGAYILRVFVQEKQEKKVASSGLPGSTKPVFFFFGVIVLATFLFDKLGYPLVSFLLLVALLRTLGMKRWVWNALLSFSVAILSYVLFARWLHIPLPKGWIGL